MENINIKNRGINRPEKIVQFGEGNFLRAFVDWQIDIINEKTDFNGNVVIVQPLEKGLGDKINAQDGLYTTILRGYKEGSKINEKRLIQSVNRCINPYQDPNALKDLAKQEEIRFVFSNTTEAGIAYNDEDSFEDVPIQNSFPAKICAFLFERYTYFDGDLEKGLIFIPCELIDKNGQKLKEFVVAYAKKWNLGNQFLNWIDQACLFCNSLVDRIVPGYPKEEAESICEELGYNDELLDTGEIFYLWVIECDNDLPKKELPTQEANLNVVWTNDLSYYRTRKVRILNGTHTMTVLGAYLAGLECVEDCIHDPIMNQFMKEGVYDEIIPSMEGDVSLLESYADDVFERFSNPYITHLLHSISLNSISKFKTRVLPSLLSYVQKKGCLPKNLVFSLSSLLCFYEGREFVDGELLGHRENNSYVIKDTKEVLEIFFNLYNNCANMEIPSKAFFVANAILSKSSWWGMDLTSIEGLEDQIVSNLILIWEKGMRNAFKEITK